MVWKVKLAKEQIKTQNMMKHVYGLRLIYL